MDSNQQLQMQQYQQMLQMQHMQQMQQPQQMQQYQHMQQMQQMQQQGLQHMQHQSFPQQQEQQQQQLQKPQQQMQQTQQHMLQQQGFQQGAVMAAPAAPQPGTLPMAEAPVPANTVAAAAVAAAAVLPAAPQEDSAEQRRREDVLVEKARQIQDYWQRLAQGYGPKHDDPPRPLTHWDFLLKEAHWLAKDMGQERMWKQRAAYHIGHAAAAEGRMRLEAAVAKQEAAAHQAAATTKSSARGSKIKKEEAEQQQQQQQHKQSIAEIIIGADGPSQELQVDFLHFWANNGEFTQCVIAHLENADVQRLLRIYHYTQKYDADWEMAWLHAEQKEAELRKNEPLPSDEDALAKRGKRKGPKAVRVEMDDEMIEDLGGTPTPVAMPKAAQQAYGRDKRKRKARDYDDEDYVAGVKSGRVADKRTGALAGAAAGSGMARSGSDMSLAAAGDPRLNKRLKSQTTVKQNEAVLPRVPGQLTQQRNLARSQSAALPHSWGYDDDALLAALVVEYGYNWHFIADTVSSTCSLQGITRRTEWCKQRHSQIMKSAEQPADPVAGGVGPDGQPLDPDAAAAAAGAISNLANLSKQQAKELIMRSLPVPESIIKRHADAVAPLYAKRRAQVLQDRENVRKQNMVLAEPHGSHFKLTQAALSQSGGRILNPLEVTEQEKREKEQAATLARQQEQERLREQQAAAATAAQQAAQQQQQQAQQQAVAAVVVQQQQGMAAAQQQQAISGGGAPSQSLGSQGAIGAMPGTAAQVQAQHAAAMAAAAASQQQAAQQQAVAAMQAQAAAQQQQHQQVAGIAPGQAGLTAVQQAALQQRPGTPSQANTAATAATLQALAQRTASLPGAATAGQLTPTSSAQLLQSQGSAQAATAAAAAAAAAVQQRAAAAAAAGVRPPGTNAAAMNMGPRSVSQLTPEQQKQVMLMQQQQQAAAVAAQQAALGQQGQQAGQAAAGQAAATQQQAGVQQPAAMAGAMQQVTSPSQQQALLAQRYAQQQAAQQQFMAQRMSGYQIPGATPGTAGLAMPGIIKPALAAQMAAAQSAVQAQKANPAQLQQLAAAGAGMAASGVTMPTVSTPAAQAALQTLHGKMGQAARPATVTPMMAGGMPHSGALATPQQQAAMQLTQQQALAQMQLLQPMGSAGVGAGMPAPPGAVHPGLAGAQGMNLWPLGAGMSQANLAQLMLQQQQQQPPGKQGVGAVTAAAVAQQQLAAAAAQQAAAVAAQQQQPAVSQPPAAG